MKSFPFFWLIKYIFGRMYVLKIVIIFINSTLDITNQMYECVGAPPYRYNIMISLTRCTFSRICIFGNVYYSSLKIWISVQYINIKSSRMFLNVNKTKTKQHNLKKNVTWTWRNVGIMIKYFKMTNYCNINFAMTGIFILLLSLMVML